MKWPLQLPWLSAWRNFWELDQEEGTEPGNLWVRRFKGNPKKPAQGERCPETGSPRNHGRPRAVYQGGRETQEEPANCLQSLEGLSCWELGIHVLCSPGRQNWEGWMEIRGSGIWWSPRKHCLAVMADRFGGAALPAGQPREIRD